MTGSSSLGRPLTRMGIATVLAINVGIPPNALGQVLRVTDLTAPALAKLDRSRTVVLLPGGILEERGPYLPSYTDGFLNQRLTDTLARVLAAESRIPPRQARFATFMASSPADARLDAASLRAEATRARRQRAWLTARGYR